MWKETVTDSSSQSSNDTLTPTNASTNGLDHSTGFLSSESESESEYQDSIGPTMITQTNIEKYKTNDKNNNKKKDDKIEKAVKVDNNAKKDKANKSDQNVKGDEKDKKPRKQKNAKYLNRKEMDDKIENTVKLMSRANIAETLLNEKTKQLDIVHKQVEMLKNNLLKADQLNKEQAIMIESLKRRLRKKTKQLDIVHKQVEMLKNHLLNADQLNKEQAIMIESLKRRLRSQDSNVPTNGEQRCTDQASGIMFENGGVTITPVTSTSSTSTNKISSSSQNLLSHLLHRNGNGSKYHDHNGDMATIEPIIESRSKS